MTYRIVSDSSSNILDFPGIDFKSVPLKIITSKNEYVDDSNLGLKGSPTKIAKASDKVRKGTGEKVNLDTEESVAYIMGKLTEKHVI